MMPENVAGEGPPWITQSAAALPVVVIDSPDRERGGALVTGLESLGFVARWSDAPDSAPIPATPVVRLVDAVRLPYTGADPHIVLAWNATPEALEAAISGGAYTCKTTPINIVNLAATIRAAARIGAELAALKRRTERLSESLEQRQIASTVTGILMERFNLSHADAYEKLRQYARSERKRLTEVAAQVVTSLDQQADLLKAIAATAHPLNP